MYQLLNNNILQKKPVIHGKIKISVPEAQTPCNNRRPEKAFQLRDST